jgi:hypothetical protein
MLTGLRIQLALGVERTAGALQEQVGAFTAGQLGFGSDITCHVDFLFK